MFSFLDFDVKPDRNLHSSNSIYERNDKLTNSLNRMVTQKSVVKKMQSSIGLQKSTSKINRSGSY